MIHLEKVSQIYPTRKGEVRALDGVSLQFQESEFVVVRGPSGSGKTTLLMILAGMLKPTAGRVSVEGKDLYAMDVRARAQFRGQSMGFVFQMFHLIPYLNVLENILLAAPPAGSRPMEKRAKNLLECLGLAARALHKPAELSAGEMQRTAIARALLNQPKWVLADEPTGNLDPHNAAEVASHLADYHRDGGTVIVVTHGSDADSYANRILHLREGRVDKK